MEDNGDLVGFICEGIFVSSSMFGAAATHAKLQQVSLYVVRAQYLEYSDLNFLPRVRNTASGCSQTKEQRTTL